MIEIIKNLVRRIYGYRRFLLQPKLVIVRLHEIIKKADDHALDVKWRFFPYILEQIAKKDIYFLENHKHIHNIEHQLGRFLNMKKIASEIINAIPGDIVEFGTWKGLGLCQLSMSFKDDMLQRKFIGIDSFKGLPESSTVWIKGMFDDTSLEIANQYLDDYFVKGHSHKFELIKGLFSSDNTSNTLYSLSRNVCLVHFDADLGSSTTAALKIIEPYLVDRVEPMYFLFDDWGCHPDEIPDSFWFWEKSASHKYSFVLQRLSSTNHTRYYKLIFKS